MEGVAPRAKIQAVAWPMSEGVFIVVVNDAVVSISALAAKRDSLVKKVTRWKVVTSAVIGFLPVMTMAGINRLRKHPNYFPRYQVNTCFQYHA